MSLPRSSELSPPDALTSLLPQVVSDVAEQMFFAWVESADAAQIDVLVRERHITTTQEWVQVGVAFTGAIEGRLHIACPCGLARELGSAMLGMPDGGALTSSLVDDMAGELANMICGALLTRGEPARPFEMCRPSVSRDAGQAVLPPVGAQFFTINEQPMIVWLAVSGTSD